MNHADWIGQARQHRAALLSLVSAYHPLRLTPLLGTTPGLRVTAPNAEMARRNVVQGIRRTTEGDPIKEFHAALDTGDVNRVYTLLDQAWFGVPESTSCWGIEGFKEAVALLEDPPDRDEEEERQ